MARRLVYASAERSEEIEANRGDIKPVGDNYKPQKSR